MMRGRGEVREASDELLGFAIDFVSLVSVRAEARARRFGIPIAPFRGHMDGVLDSLRGIRATGLTDMPEAAVLFDTLRFLREEFPRTFRKTMGRISAITLLPERFRKSMGADAGRRAFIANALYECEQDLLDDLVDGGGYTFEEVRRLYDLCLRPITGSLPDILEEELAGLMAPGQEGVATLLAALTKGIRGLLPAASDPDVLRRLERGHTALATGQAATTFLIRDTFDSTRLAEVAATLPAPDPEMTWLERLAIAGSWTSNLALLDACFARMPIPQEELDAHERAWFHFNAVVSYLEHFANAAQDDRDGIVNIAMVTARGTDIRADARFSGQGRDAVFAAASAQLTRAVVSGTSREDSSYYSFISLMIPSIIFTLARTPDDVVDGFFDTLAAVAFRASGYHSATYSQNPSPFRMQRVFTTLPVNPRNRRTPS